MMGKDSLIGLPGRRERNLGEQTGAGKWWFNRTLALFQMS